MNIIYTRDNDQGLEHEDRDSAERWKIIFNRHHDFIIDRMSPDFGLIDKLYSNFAISDEEKDQIEAKITVDNRNETLIKYLASRCQLGKLIDGLRESDQKYLAKYLENDGNYSNDFDGEWPLTEKEILTLKSNYESLIDLIEISNLLYRLFSMGAINRRQREFISSKSTSYEKTEALLEIVRGGSLRSYWKTIECLYRSNRSLIAGILDTGGVIVPVHATLECENLHEVETRIVNQVRVEQAHRLISALQLRQRHRLIDALYLKITAFRLGESIVIYTSCNKEEEFVHLCKIIDNLEMRDIIEQLFNQLIPNANIKVLLVNVLSEDIAKAKQTFKDMKSSWISKGSV